MVPTLETQLGKILHAAALSQDFLKLSFILGTALVKNIAQQKIIVLHHFRNNITQLCIFGAHEK